MQSDVCPLIIVKLSFLYHRLEVLVSCHMKGEKNTVFLFQDFLVTLSSMCNSDLLIRFFYILPQMKVENEPVSKERLRDLFK